MPHCFKLSSSITACVVSCGTCKLAVLKTDTVDPGCAQIILCLPVLHIFWLVG